MSRWNLVSDRLPKKLDKWGHSVHLICMEEDNDVPFIGWYNSNCRTWHVSHWSAMSRSIEVYKWKYIPKKGL